MPQVRFRIKCPKCGATQTLELSEEDMNIARESGIARFGFIHRDHILIIDIDQNYFVRGAYLSSMTQVYSNVKLSFRDYRVIIYPQINTKSKVLILNNQGKIFDARSLPRDTKKLYPLLDESIRLCSRKKKYRWYRGTVDVHGETYDIAYSNNKLVMLKTDIRDWKEKTQILKTILSITPDTGIPAPEELQKMLEEIDSKTSKARRNPPSKM